MTYRKKLIEVALPLDAINRESAREKSIRHGHPSTLHLWWARRPLASCRAVIFASLVDDPEQEGVPQELLDAIDALPSPHQGAADAAGSLRRAKLFLLIEELVKWENTTNEALFETTRKVIRAATGGTPPPLLDPFCGGGSIPLEAQRLGLEAYASDLNPVAVLITKALIEIPPKFAGKPPVNPESRKGTGGSAVWKGASGLAADVRYYGKWMRDEAWKRIGHLYPQGPKGETIIAWLWARTVKCPNPACGAQMPLVRSFWLSTKKDKAAWVRPVMDTHVKTVRFEVKTGNPLDLGTVAAGTGFVGDRGKRTKAVFRCVVCAQGVAKGEYIDAAASAGPLGVMPLAEVLEGSGTRIYKEFSEDAVGALNRTVKLYLSNPEWLTNLPHQEGRGTFASNAQGRRYGFKTFSDYFTPRQLVALTTFSDLIQEARAVVLKDSGGDEAYGNAVATCLALVLGKFADLSNSLCAWEPVAQCPRHLFARQAIPMVWDFAEGNPFSDSSGSWSVVVGNFLRGFVAPLTDFYRPKSGHVDQLDASNAVPDVSNALVLTDPPYYDNVSYADLSDFFYVWLRRSVRIIYPDLFSTLLTPKGPELVATPYRFGGDKRKAEAHFETGLGRAFALMRQRAHPDYPVTLYYAFKQAEEENGNSDGSSGAFLVRASTGWETMLQGVLAAGFQVTGTWPMRTEMRTRQVAMGTNALASSIVIACRPRAENAPIATRREFLSALRRELPGELKVLMGGRVAPVDLAQATIGPGMAAFSRYSRVLEADGSPMTVRTALQEINYVIEDILAQQEGDLDVESQFCVAWFQQYGQREGPFGEADVLARAKNVSVDGLARHGLTDAARGKVRLTLREDYEDGWDPQTQSRLTAWEACQRLVWTLNENGEQDAGRLARRLGGLADQARELAYRLYGIADRKGWTEEALGYNALVASWSEVQKAAAAAAEETQGRMV